MSDTVHSLMEIKRRACVVYRSGMREYRCYLAEILDWLPTRLVTRASAPSDRRTVLRSALRASRWRPGMIRFWSTQQRHVTEAMHDEFNGYLKGYCGGSDWVLVTVCKRAKPYTDMTKSFTTMPNMAPILANLHRIDAACR